MNGALTIGTLDGANIELREEIGAENFFLFGLSVEEVLALKSRGYRPMDYYAANQQLREVIDLLRSGFFTRGDTTMLQPLMDNLMQYDPYMLFADFASYLECQEKVSAAYRDAENWTRMAILNTARSGKFSSDRSIREYSADIWQVESVPITLLPQEHSPTSAEYA
jgi:starch phosphorylase